MTKYLGKKMLKRREVSLWLTASEGFLCGHLTLFQSLGKNSVVVENYLLMPDREQKQRQPLAKAGYSPKFPPPGTPFLL